jgi:short-subunit dehydrogenase
MNIVTATTVLSAAAIRAFVPRKAGGIINLSSVLALAPEVFDGAYSSTKAFVLNLSQGMVKEADENGVRIHVVLPGATRTEIWERSGKDLAKIPADKLMEAGDLVDAALKGFDRGETVTIPSLRDVKQWESMQHARHCASFPEGRSIPHKRQTMPSMSRGRVDRIELPADDPKPSRSPSQIAVIIMFYHESPQF